MSDHPSPGVGPALSALIERWRYVAESCREIASNETDAEREGAMRAAAVNRDECARELETALLGSVGGLNAAPAAFTENEIKDVLTSLYQDGHVDLVLADRVAALMALPASPVCAAEKKIEKG